MSDKPQYYKTTFTVTVLSTGSPVSADAELEDVLREMSEGEYVGDVELSSVEEIEADCIRAELRIVGNDGSFFGEEEEDDDDE